MDIEKVLDFIKQLHKEKEEAILRAYEAKSLLESKPKHQSEYINELAAALAKAQSVMPIALEASDNPYFKSKYADLPSHIRASRPSLTANGLSVVQQEIHTDLGETILHTKLLHSSGQWIGSTFKLSFPKPDPQSIGSYLTYMRRYCYSSLINTVPAEGEDDDGESLMKHYPASRAGYEKGTSTVKAQQRSSDNPDHNDFDTITREQYNTIQHMLTGCEDIGKRMLEKKGLKTFMDLPKSLYNEAIDHINNVKKATGVK